jgi:hypothetical protein
MNRPAMMCLLPVAGGHLQRHHCEVPAQVVGQRRWRHRRRAKLAHLLAPAVPLLAGVQIRRRDASPATKGANPATKGAP